ncbi:hypothetical protein Clacol_002936 [Clathrus columnatus]|uniref:Arrestin-like N-terminal domain-containing protein n=1 Tax=Clathrus columnatus TaxID=1419009 RepID=A0AAV5A257_9AGAM|nr:hypothetical protein Clacol_002936 [Clathrus columnatus]
MATGPAYMNATTSHPKVKATITLSAPLFVAGQDITGKVELDCKAEREVGIGLIMVELLAMQGLNSRDHTATTTFVHSHRLFQGHGLPPSNAVYDHTNPQDPSFPPNYFPGRKGITTFFFKFPTPVSSPSSVSFASDVARIEYKVRVNIGVAYKGDVRLLTNTVDAELVQCQDMEGTVEEHVVIGENGKVYVRGKLVSGRAIVGEKGCLELHVKNQTSKKTTGLTLALTRSLHLCGAGNSIPVQLTDTLITESFRSAEYCVPPGIEGVANLVFDVPSSTRVVKGGLREGNLDSSGVQKHIDPLFELRCYLSVKIGMGLGGKDILFEMPIQVKHRAALGRDPAQDRNTALSPVSPEPVFNRAISPLQSHSPRALSPFPIQSPHTMSPLYPNHTPGPSPVPNNAYYQQSPRKPTVHPPALNPGDPAYARALSPRLWSPIPAVPYTSQPPLPAYYFPPPPTQLLPFAYPARPNSADPHYYTYYHNQTPLHSGLPPVSGTSPFLSSYMPYQPSFQYQNQSSVPPAFNPLQPSTSIPPRVTQSTEEALEEIPSSVSQLRHQPLSQVEVQPEQGKGERASRIASRLHASNRARSVSPTSHRFPAVTTSTIKQPSPQVVEASTPPRLHLTSPRPPPVLSPRPVVSPSRTYIGESSTRIGNGTAKSDRVDLLERLVDLAPGDEEKTVDEVLKDLEEAERKQAENELAMKNGETKVDIKPSPLGSVNHPSLLDVFGQQLPSVKELNDNGASSSPIVIPDRINKFKLGTHNEGLDALERRLLQEVGTRKPETNRPAVFSFPFVDKASKEALSDSLERGNSRPPSPSTVRLHPNPLRESQISELALNIDGNGDKDHVNKDIRTPPSPAVRHQKQSQDQDQLRKVELQSFKKDIDARNEAKGRVAEWLGGLQTFSSSPASTDTAPAVHLAEPKNVPPRKRSIDGVLGFFGIGRSKSKDDLRATSPVIPPSPIKGPGHPDISINTNDKLAIPSPSIPLIPESPSQRRTPSPSRKPAPKYIESPPQKAEKVPASTKVVSVTTSVEDALPTSPAAATSARKPVPKMVQATGQEMKTGKLIPDSSKVPSNSLTIQTTEILSEPQFKEAKREAKLPFKPTKPDIVRGRPINSPSIPVIPSKTVARSLESPSIKPLSSTPREINGMKGDIRNKNTLPPIPASASVDRLVLPSVDSGAKYDVRSARGGRGGITTSVAAIWASRAEENDKETKLPPVSDVSRDKPLRRPQSFDPGKGKASSAPTTRTSQNDEANPSFQGATRGAFKLETTARDPIKSTSVPTKVDRYHAKPQLSSVATLAQPVISPKYKPPSLSIGLGTISEQLDKDSTSSSSAKISDERLYGQTRLKDLIKKYQQEAS